MTFERPVPAGLFAAFRASRRGSVAVEFALIATILIVSLGAIVDLMTISTLNREIERSSTQIAGTLTSCERKNMTDSSCISNTLKMYLSREDNILVRMPNATVRILQVVDNGGAITVCPGTTTYIDTDVAASALAVLNNKDTAIVVVIETDYVALLPTVMTRMFAGQATSHLRGWTTAVQTSGSSGSSSC